MAEKNTNTWKFHNGTHFYVETNGIGGAAKVLGVVSPAEDDKYVGCIHNKFDTYREFDNLQDGMIQIAALCELEL